jgi:hypothetical protein
VGNGAKRQRQPTRSVLRCAGRLVPFVLCRSSCAVRLAPFDLGNFLKNQHLLRSNLSGVSGD